MMRVCLSFSHNPFAGVVCNKCGIVSNPPHGITRRVLTDHKRRNHDDDNHDLDVQVQVDNVCKQGTTLAELHHSLPLDSLPLDSEKFDLYLKYWSNDFHSIFWCATGPFRRLFLTPSLLSVSLPPSLACLNFLSPPPLTHSICVVLFLFLSPSLATLQKIKKNSLPFLLSVSSLSSVFSHRFHLFLLTLISA